MIAHECLARKIAKVKRCQRGGVSSVRRDHRGTTPLGASLLKVALRRSGEASKLWVACSAEHANEAKPRPTLADTCDAFVPLLP